MIAVHGASASVAGESEPLIVGLFDALPANTAEKNPVFGRSAIWSRKILDAAGLEAKWRSMPPGRLYRLLALGEVNLAVGAAYIAENEPEILAGSSSAFLMDIGLYAREATIPPLAALSDETLILVHGYTYKGIAEELATLGDDIQKIYASDHRTALAMLDSGRARYMIGLHPMMQPLAAEDTSKPVFRRTLKSVNVTWLVYRNTPNAEGLLRRLDLETEALGPIPDVEETILPANGTVLPW